MKSSNYSIIGYGGRAGGAKSHGVRDVGLTMASEYPSLSIGIFRRVSKQLTSNHIIPFFTKYPYLRQYFNKSERILYLPNTSHIHFCSADLEDDIYNYQGDEFDICFVDEATHFSQVMIEFLGTRVRSKILPKAKVVLTMNPGNIGHAYIKRLFIDRVYRDNEDEGDYYYLPAKIYDNVIWSESALSEAGYTVGDYYGWTDEKRKEFCYKYSDYAKRLSKLPEDLKLAYLEGDWTVFGGMFFKGIDKKKQEIEPFDIPSEWALVGSVDPGYSSPCSFGITARDFEGNCYRVATYYEKERSPIEHLEGIKAFIRGLRESGMIKRNPSYIVSGKDAWAKKDRYSIMANELTFADIFARGGLPLQSAITDRKAGWWAWKSLIPDKYFWFRGLNQDLYQEMSGVITDGRDIEDIQGRGNDINVSDHALDEQRYGIMALFKPEKYEEVEIRPSEREVVLHNESSWASY